ncbi:MAG: TonB-dependent receptor [Parvularculaceae bacterium]
MLRPYHRPAGSEVFKSILTATACTAGLAALAPAALAQDASSGDQASPDRRDQIIVTARRRAESLQDVPVSVSAFDEGRIHELQADNISGIQYATPNVYLDQGDASNAVIYIRGVGQNDSLAFADPGVGVYVDDVFVARSQAAFLELFDVERVEVLRGPQGTLYGRNTIGGAVKFVSTKPPDEFDAYFEAGVGNFNFGTVKGRIGGPLNEERTLRGKIAFSASRRDGFNHNTITDEDDGGQLTFAGRGSLLYAPSDRTEFLLSVEGKVDRPDTSRSPVRETAIAGAPDPGDPFNIVVFPASDDPFRVDVNANGLSDLTSFAASLKSTWRASDTLSFESISAYRRMDFDLNLDTDGSPLPILDILLLQDQYQFTQELRATYDDGDRVVFTGGLYYFHDDDLTFSGVDNGAATIFGFPVTLFGFQSSSLADTDQVTNSYAAFGDASFKLADQIDLSAGLRYTYEKRRSARRFENFFDPSVSVIEDTPPFLQGAGVPGTLITGKADFDALTPRVSLSYSPNDDLMFYASASRGFKSGGFDGRATTDFSFEAFKPEFVWSYEGGLKSSWHDGRLVFNAAYFYNDYTDIQVTSFGSDPVSGVFVSLFTNAAEAHAQGVEIEMTAQPTDALTLNGSVGFLDAEYDKFETLVGGVVTDVSDRELVNSPKWNAYLGATYETPVTNSLIGTAHVEGAYRGVTFNEITASPILAEDRYVLLNAFVSLRTADERWELRGGVRNATDQAIRVQGFNLSEFPGVQLAFFTAPRTYDFRLIYRY